MSRRVRGANTRSRLLCPLCNEVMRVVIVADGVIRLECGHERGELLPVKDGRVSVEHMGQRIGREMFPAKPDGERTAELPWREWRERRWR